MFISGPGIDLYVYRLCRKEKKKRNDIRRHISPLTTVTPVAIKNKLVLLYRYGYFFPLPRNTEVRFLLKSFFIFSCAKTYNRLCQQA